MHYTYHKPILKVKEYSIKPIRKIVCSDTKCGVNNRIILFIKVTSSVNRFFLGTDSYCQVGCWKPSILTKPSIGNRPFT